MTTTYQQDPNSTLQQFIQQGEAELESLEEPERTLRAQSLFAEMQRRFPSTNGAEIADFTEPPSDVDVEDVVFQDSLDREERESTYTDYEEGDGEGRDHFRSHLRVKCMDSVKQPKLHCHATVIGPAGEQQTIEVVLKPLPVNQFPETIVRGPDKEIMLEDGLAFSEFKPTGSYHQRVAGWMAQTARVPKEWLKCQYCGGDFEGKKKGQKFCSVQCGRRSRQGVPLPVIEEQHEPGVCGCLNCEQVYDIFMEMRHEHMVEKYGTGEWPKGASLTEQEKEVILDFAKHQVSNDEQQ
jgi:hypothetical protein